MRSSKACAKLYLNGEKKMTFTPKFREGCVGLFQHGMPGCFKNLAVTGLTDL